MHGILSRGTSQDGCTLFMDRERVQVRKFSKKERGQYPAILTERLVNKLFLICLSGKFFSRGKAGIPERERELYLARGASQSQRRIPFILPSYGASHVMQTSAYFLAPLQHFLAKHVRQTSTGSVFISLRTKPASQKQRNKPVGTILASSDSFHQPIIIYSTDVTNECH